MARVELTDGWQTEVGRALAGKLGDAVDWIADEAERLARAEAFGTGQVEGHYADSIQARVVRYRRKTVGKVEATKFTAGWLEHGTARMGAERILARAAEASGLSTQTGRRRSRRRRAARQ
jgi:hypothetical protein